MKHLLLGLALCAAPLAPAFAADCKPLQLVATVPLDPQDDHRVEYVPVKLNGVDKKLLLDTGGSLSQLSQQVVDELKLPTGGSGFRLSGLTGRVSQATASVEHFEMGSLRARDLSFQISPDFDMGAAGMDGLIAIDLFLSYDLDLDFGHDKLNFVSSDHCDGKVIYWPAEVRAEVPMRIVDGHYLIDVTLDGRHLIAMLDTGADITTIGWDTASQFYALSPDTAGVEKGGKVNLTVDSYHHKFGTLAFEGIEIHTPTLDIVKSNGLLGRRESTGGRVTSREDIRDHVDMILGMDMMRHLHVYIATKERKVYITPA